MRKQRGQRKGQVRIIGGNWKGRKISFPENPSLRPTLARTRETLFNWLRPQIEGTRCLDLFAGSGILGLEALSQGAQHVSFVERDRRAAQSLRDNLVALDAQAQAEVCCADAQRVITNLQGPYDIIFLDPPYSATALLLSTCKALREARLLGRFVYLELPAREDIEPLTQTLECKPHRECRAGDTRGHLLRSS
ncbi:MAG: 16S rRNA (guanine(966)-N(2))-methyltransferase RsmD [Pseudomonadota bacterium]